MSATWSYKDTGSGLKIYRLTLTAHNRYEPAYPLNYHMYYQGWAWNACSSAMLWKWNGIPTAQCTEEVLAGFIDVLFQVKTHSSTWDAHRVFAQVPETDNEHVYESPFFELMLEKVYPGIAPVYVFENRSHKSSPQRIFDLDTDLMFQWKEKYHAEQKAKQVAAGGSDRTITLGNGAGKRPVASREYFR